MTTEPEQQNDDPIESSPHADDADTAANAAGAGVDGSIKLDIAGEDEDPLAAMTKERDDLHEKLLRAHADYQNLGRRMQTSVTEARDQQLMNVAKSMLTVLDNFDHALAVDPATTSPEDLVKGVEIVRDQLVQTLSQFEVVRFSAEPGEDFDPNRHEALMRQTVEGMEPGKIGQELQPGYMIGDRTLRPAKVSVTE